MAAPKVNLFYEAQLGLRVFHGAQALGNSARCFILSNFPVSDRIVCQWRNANAHARGETWCLLWRERRSVRVIALQRGREIQFCGHGLVAAGAYWFRRYGELAVLATRNARYATRRCWREGHFAVAAARFDAKTLRPYRCENTWFDIAPQQCFSIGADNGYLLCVWPRGMDIAAIEVNNAAIALQPRAIVMTQCDIPDVNPIAEKPAAKTIFHENNTDDIFHGNAFHENAFDFFYKRPDIRNKNSDDRDSGDPDKKTVPFDLRYLAPQYGNPEDRATGSAAAIAANYWHLRFQARPGQRYIATQRSREGGDIHCAVDGDHVWIGGRVTPAPFIHAREIEWRALEKARANSAHNH